MSVVFVDDHQKLVRSHFAGSGEEVVVTVGLEFPSILFGCWNLYAVHSAVAGAEHEREMKQTPVSCCSTGFHDHCSCHF